MKQSRTVSKSRRNNSSTPIKQQRTVKPNGESEFYFCHFKNCMYMGGIKSFQKHGRGIIIHDDGTSAVTSYFNDFKNGHNILYKQNCIMSIEYQKNKVTQCAIRISVYLLLIRYGKQQKPEGKSVLIDYENRKIFYILFKKGVVVQKHQEHDTSILNRIFDIGNLQYLLGPNHSNAIKLQIEKDQNIASQKLTSKFQAGFFKKGLLNGLGFVLLIKNPSQSSDSRVSTNQIFLQIAQRGYFHHGQLNGMGQKWFKNGNYYAGQFKNGVFEGNGILKNQVKKNWVFGAFQAGQLSQLIHYSHEGDVNKLNKLILSMHQRKNNWINNDIQLQSQEQYLKQIQKILKSNPTEQLKSLKDRKYQVLRKIQDNFLYDDPNTSINNEGKPNFHSNQQNQPRNSNLSQISNNKNSQLFKNQAKKVDQKQPLYISAGNIYNSRYKAQFIQPVHTTKGSSSRLRQENSSRPQASAIQSSRAKTPQMNLNKKPSTIKISQNYEDPSFTLDSKRLIGRSRIFRNFITNQDEQSSSLPKFNYTPAK